MCGKGVIKKMPTSQKIIDVLSKNDWKEVRVNGSHHHFKHKTNPNLVTVVHPRKDNPIGYVKTLEKITGLKF
jgi:predicted RNA binding protein YcfA (HicA-like mRNA interferase family)